MSIPKDLDEYTDEELRAELTRRDRARGNGTCHYCRRSASWPACSRVDEHTKKEPS